LVDKNIICLLSLKLLVGIAGQLFNAKAGTSNPWDEPLLRISTAK